MSASTLAIVLLAVVASTFALIVVGFITAACLISGKQADLEDERDKIAALQAEADRIRELQFEADMEARSYNEEASE